MKSEKDIVRLGIDFENRRIKVAYKMPVDNNPELIATRDFKFVLASPVGLVLQGVRKWVFHHLMLVDEELNG